MAGIRRSVDLSSTEESQPSKDLSGHEKIDRHTSSHCIDTMVTHSNEKFGRRYFYNHHSLAAVLNDQFYFLHLNRR